MFIPDVIAGAADEYHLARVGPPPVVESSTVNPDGIYTHTRTFGVESLTAHCAHADRRTADGRGCGYGKTVAIDGRSAFAAAVHRSMSWTDRRGRPGSMDEELLLPWLASARREAAGGWIEATITRIAERVSSAAAADPAA